MHKQLKRIMDVAREKGYRVRRENENNDLLVSFGKTNSAWLSFTYDTVLKEVTYFAGLSGAEGGKSVYGGTFRLDNGRSIPSHIVHLFDGMKFVRKSNVAFLVK